MELKKKNLESKSKINFLADESIRLGQKSTLIIFVKTSIDDEAAPVSFLLDLVDLETLCASHIKDAILDCLRKNGFTTELLQEVFIGFCSDGASVMLGNKIRCWKLLRWIPWYRIVALPQSLTWTCCWQCTRRYQWHKWLAVFSWMFIFFT